MGADPASAGKHRVVVVGAGFGGLSFVDGSDGQDYAITLIDKQNHHLFQPLLYQAATTVLPVTDIAWPIRILLRNRRDVSVVQDEVCDIDTTSRHVLTTCGESIPYDTLILSPGTVPSYFGHDEWAAMAPGLKTAGDALAIRTRMLAVFEECEREAAGRAPVIAIIGGGPTGVELAGMIATLCNKELRRDFRTFDPAETRIVIVDAADRILSALPENLADHGEKRLKEMGVELRLGEGVTDCRADRIVLKNGELPCDMTIWAAGTQAVPIAKWLGVEADRGGRIAVRPDLSVPDHPEIFVIGDAAKVAWKEGGTVPGLAPAAKQEGAFIAKLLAHRLGGAKDPGPFEYEHQGDLATIGRNEAVVRFGKISLTGRTAWWLWGMAHIFFLITMRSRIAVLLHWLSLHWRERSDARLSFSPTVGPDRSRRPSDREEPHHERS